MMAARGDLRDVLRHAQSKWSWAWLVPAFGDSRISPTDVDGFVERNGQFLVLECKPVLEAMPQGQRLALTALARIPVFTVLILIGNPPDDPRELITLPNWDVREPVTQEQMIETVRRWYEWANSPQQSAGVVA